MKRGNSDLATSVLAVLLLFWPNHSVKAQEASNDTADVSERVESYVAEFNKRNVSACVEHWSETAAYNVSGGKPIVGRPAIGEALQKLLGTDEQFEMSVANQRFRKVVDNVVLEDGIATLVSETHGIEYARYVVVHVKQNGTWYRDSIHETLIGTLPATTLNPQDLESLVGTWNAKSHAGSTKIQSRWTHAGRFMTRSFGMQDGDGQKTSVTEVIGWDPSVGVLRSWSFDSQGGFEQAVWNRDGDQWLIKASAVLPNGSTATEQRTLSVDADGNLITQIIEQQFGGRLLPGSEPVTFVRDASENGSRN